MDRTHELKIPRTLEEVCEPGKVALIVYDMQAGILRQLSDGDEITARAARVLEAARAAGVRTFFMRHMSLPKELAGTFQLRMAMAWQRVETVEEVQPWFLRGTPGFEIVPEVAPLPSEAIFDKLAMSAFEGTPLNFALRDYGINAFIIVGVAMEIGILPTALHAADLGFIPVVVTDACGYGDKEAAERSFAHLQFTGDTLLTDTDTIRAILQQHAASG